MRIIGGRFKGRVLTALGGGDTGRHLRPTSDHVRENIFNLLQNSIYNMQVTGTQVLDLCAGSGALGFEALSRGAATVCFVDNGAKAQNLISKNIELLKVKAQVTIYRRNALYLNKLNDDHKPYDLVFIDPPYGKNLGARILKSAYAGAWLASQAVIIWEENAPQDIPKLFDCLDIRRYGTTFVHILRLNAAHDIRTLAGKADLL